MPPRNTRPRPGQRTTRAIPLAQPTPFDLDAIESETELFQFTVGGEEFTLSSPEDIDWQDAAATDESDLVGSIRLMLGAEQYERFRQHSVSLGKLTKLATTAMEHYGMGEGSA